MRMPIKKFFLALLFGSLFAPAGRAFAGPALDQLRDSSPNFDGTADYSANIPVPVPPAAFGDTGTGDPAALAEDTKDATAAVPAVTTAPTPPAPTPAPNPVKEFFSKHSTEIVVGGLGAYLGFALLGGPVGMLIGAVCLLGLLMLANA